MGGGGGSAVAHAIVWTQRWGLGARGNRSGGGGGGGGGAGGRGGENEPGGSDGGGGGERCCTRNSVDTTLGAGCKGGTAASIGAGDEDAGVAGCESIE